MLKFIKKVFLFSFPIFVFIVFVNYFVDPGNLFKEGLESDISNCLIKGQNVTNIDNFDERILQKKLIESEEFTKYDIIVLGSSRSLLINSSYFNKSKVFNSSVSAATVNDLISIFQLYKENNKIPENIIINIDPWLLSDNSGMDKWKALRAEYNRFLGIEKSVSNPFLNNKFFELISLSYLKSSLNLAFKPRMEAICTISSENEKMTKLKDGSIVYGVNYRNMGLLESSKRIDEYILSNQVSSSQGYHLSEEKSSNFMKLLDDMRNRKIKVTFFLAPYPLRVYEFLNKKEGQLQVLTNYIKSISKNRGINVLGSFKPYEVGVSDSLFYDGLHCKPTALDKILINYKL
jgi:hypothetical protein